MVSVGVVCVGARSARVVSRQPCKRKRRIVTAPPPPAPHPPPLRPAGALRFYFYPLLIFLKMGGILWNRPQRTRLPACASCTCLVAQGLFMTFAGGGHRCGSSVWVWVRWVWGRDGVGRGGGESGRAQEVRCCGRCGRVCVCRGEDGLCVVCVEPVKRKADGYKPPEERRQGVAVLNIAKERPAVKQVRHVVELTRCCQQVKDGPVTYTQADQGSSQPIGLPLCEMSLQQHEGHVDGWRVECSSLQQFPHNTRLFSRVGGVFLPIVLVCAKFDSVAEYCEHGAHHLEEGLLFISVGRALFLYR